MRACSTIWMALLVCFLLSAAPGSGSDIPALERVIGPPALGFSPYSGSTGPYWPIAADDRQLYVAAEARVEVFTLTGEWVGFWPVSSAARGLGEPRAEWLEGATGLGAISGSPWGWVYVSDSAYGAVHILDQEGSFIGGWGGFGDGPNEIPEGHSLRAIATSADESVYVLGWGEWPERGGSIRRFAKDGTFLNSWSTPTETWPPRWCEALDVDADAAGSVWLLTRTVVLSGDIAYAEEARVHQYDTQGNELASWPVPTATLRIEVERGEYPDDLWALIAHPSRVLARYRLDGTGGATVQIDSPWVGDFALDDDNNKYILAQELIPGQDEHYEYASSLRIETWKRAQHDDIFCDYADMLARGALLASNDLAVAPQGGMYAKINGLRPDFNYVSHFDADGALLEVLRTDDWPTYMPDTGAVEFLSQRCDVVDADGTCYVLESLREEIGEETAQWSVVATKHARDGLPMGSFTVAGPIAEKDAWMLNAAERPSGCLGADGNLRLAMGVGRPEYGVLWVAVVTPQGDVLNSWLDESFGPHDVNAVAVDPGGNVYVAGNGAWKYDPRGNRLGEIGAWGGESGETASFISSAAAIDVDETGRVRVLDSAPDYSHGRDGYAANHLLVFAHEPGPFLDVPYWHWAKDAVAAAADAGIVFGDGLYRPEAQVTRAQMAVYVSRCVAGGDEGIPEGPSQPTFADVPQSHWAFDYVEYCHAQNVVEGVQPRFYEPDLRVDRGQMAVYVARAMVAPTTSVLDDYVPADPRNFPDVPSDFWAYPYVEYCVEHDIVGGYEDGYYRPDWTVNRAQMAVYVARAFGLGE